MVWLKFIHVYFTIFWDCWRFVEILLKSDKTAPEWFFSTGKLPVADEISNKPSQNTPPRTVTILMQEWFELKA